MFAIRAWLGHFLLVIFVGVVAYTLWTATVGWDTPIVQQYEFVQAKAAIVAYYIAQGGPIVNYEMPIHGAPWSIPYEFPFYQTATAWFHNLAQMPLEQAGRAVAKFFFYLTLLPLWFIARELGFSARLSLIPLTLFLASPMYLFWSRNFMNESTATFFAIAYLAAVMVWARRGGGAALVLAILLGCAAALAKSTTYASFALASGLVLVFSVYRKRDFSRLLPCLAILILPLSAGLFWVQYTDGVKSLNPIAANFHTSAALSKWYLSTELTERFNGGFWYRLFRVTLHDAIGHRTVWILSLLLAAALGLKARIYWLCSALFLVAPMLFTHAHLLHDYYAHANAVFMVFGVAVLVKEALKADKKWLNICGLIFFVMIIGYEVRDFMSKGYKQQQEWRMDSIDFARKLKDLVPAGEVVLMFGEDWCPVIPFYAERRAIMLWKGAELQAKLSQSLDLLEADGKKIGAVVLCHEARFDKEFLGLKRMGKNLLKDRCDVYAYRP